ncbi:MAG: hypothetical protein EBS53_16355 [Bacteroidetes bacterium]|nr:hypothetical protein [Bacteroidota bacterium]
MTATITIDQAISRVDEAVEKVKNDAEQRFPDAASVGDAVRQGDIYIQKIDDVTSCPKLYRLLQNPQYPMQLAPGNTKGSRHMLEASDGATVYVLNVAEISDPDDWQAVRDSTAALSEEVRALAATIAGTDEEKENGLIRWSSPASIVADQIADALGFCGPIFNLTKEGKVSHPEHGDWVLPPGSYRITFQRTVASDRSIRRVLD